MPGVTVSESQLAQIFGISHDRIEQMIAEGMPDWKATETAKSPARPQWTRKLAQSATWPAISASSWPKWTNGYDRLPAQNNRAKSALRSVQHAASVPLALRL